MCLRLLKSGRNTGLELSLCEDTGCGDTVKNPRSFIGGIAPVELGRWHDTALP